MIENNESQNKSENPDLKTKIDSYKSKYENDSSVSEDTLEENSQEKVIQIVMGLEGLPSIKYNGSTLTLAEVIGILESTSVLVR